MVAASTVYCAAIYYQRAAAAAATHVRPVFLGNDTCWQSVFVGGALLHHVMCSL